VLVYAHRKDDSRHSAFRAWLTDLIAAPRPFALSELVLSGFLRVVTNPRVFARPTPLADALAFCSALRSRPNAVVVSPGPRHWEIFAGLCDRAQVKGNLVADAYLAALAIESGSEWATTDRDFARFHGLSLAEVPA
jgi:toxin-antitoxin system PIN domain toxin